MHVKHYRCYDADQRISMQVYANDLERALTDKALHIESFQPQSRLERFGSSRLMMRFLRYFRYPRAVRKSEADIHHILDHGYAHLVTALGRGKKCITVHDLIPLLAWKGRLGVKPDGNSKQRRPALNLHSLSFLPKFDLIFVPSKNTAKDLVEHLDVPKKKIAIIPMIVGPEFAPMGEQMVRNFSRRHKLDTKCKWVMVSGQEFYKNHRISLQVLADLNTKSGVYVKLIKTGMPSAEFDRLVAEMDLENLVTQVYLKDRIELAELYNFVDCLLFPSLYEGFGMPVAEAMACGTPVIISDRGSLPEVAGGLAPQFNPFDVQGISKATYKYLYKEELIEKVQKQGPELMKRYRSEAVSRKVIKLYQSLNPED